MAARNPFDDLPKDVITREMYPYLTNEEYKELLRVNRDIGASVRQNRDQFTRQSMTYYDARSNFETSVLLPHLKKTNKRHYQDYKALLGEGSDSDATIIRYSWMEFDDEGPYHPLWTSYFDQLERDGYMIGERPAIDEMDGMKRGGKVRRRIGVMK